MNGRAYLRLLQKMHDRSGFSRLRSRICCDASARAVLTFCCGVGGFSAPVLGVG
jgi:hypothetical protein